MSRVYTDRCTIGESKDYLGFPKIVNIIDAPRKENGLKSGKHTNEIAKKDEREQPSKL